MLTLIPPATFAGAGTNHVVFSFAIVPLSVSVLIAGMYIAGTIAVLVLVPAQEVPALFRYFESAPERLYVEVRAGEFVASRFREEQRSRGSSSTRSKESQSWPRASGHDVHGYYMMKALAARGISGDRVEGSARIARHSATVATSPLYDPGNARLRM